MDATLRQSAKLLALFEGTSREQVQVLLASGLLADLRDTNVAEVNRGEFRKFVGLESLNSLNAEAKPLLLELIGTVTISAMTERFLARERFVLNYGRRAKPGVRISHLGYYFKEWFLEKIEELAVSTTLRYAKLLRSEVDGPIMDELGDAKETTLAEIYALLCLQANGEKGVLLTNGWANIFYVRDVNDELRAVNVLWDGLGWLVGADPVAGPGGWRGEDRVFSRNS